MFFWLHSPEQAKERVAERVSKGGHHIPDDVVERRYYRGIHNFFELYSPVCDNWSLFDNTKGEPELIAQGKENTETDIVLPSFWNQIKDQVS